MLDLHLSVTRGIVPCRVHLLIHRRVRGRWIREVSGAIVARIGCFAAASGSVNGRACATARGPPLRSTLRSDREV